jgi:crotonobetainyl-CoA:carnitine CoA-transferase CaiB-like acyl-CoA transferase
MNEGALGGVLVADFSRVLAGPYATMLLADLGATVVKVERPGLGDDTRAWGPPFSNSGQSTYFESINRNKMSIALDFTADGDLAVARRLSGVADVVIENFTPGSLTRYGLDGAQTLRRNPRAVYCSISGFGSGEGAQMPGYDLLVQAMGGLMSVTGHDAPTKAGVAVVDVLTGLHAAVAILAALRHRDVAGNGQVIEVSLLSTLLSSLVNQSGAFAGAGVVPGLLGNAHPSIAPYEVYSARDRALVLAVGNDGQFRALVGVLGEPALADDGRFITNAARVDNRHELNVRLQHLLELRDAEDWRIRLTAAGVPCGPINSLDGAFGLAGALGLPSIVEIARADGTPARQVANPLQMSDTPVTYQLAPPELDADRAAVLALLASRG